MSVEAAGGRCPSIPHPDPQIHCNLGIPCYYWLPETVSHHVVSQIVAVLAVNKTELLCN